MVGSSDEVKKRRRLRRTLRLSLLSVIGYYLVLPALTDIWSSAPSASGVRPEWPVTAVGLQVAAWLTYTALTQSALRETGSSVSFARLWRVQMATKATSTVVPAGGVAGPALGYRLLLRAGVGSGDAAFALGASAVGSAVMLNVMLWAALVVSVPIRGVNGWYVLVAAGGVVVLVVAAALTVALADDTTALSGLARWTARRVRRDEDRFTAAVQRLGTQIRQLTSSPALIGRIAGWATTNWLFDAASLWTCLRAFGVHAGADAALVAFGLANLAAAVPITPSGLGIVEWTYLSVLVGFGYGLTPVALGIALYRVIQLLTPVPVGAIAYLSLRHGRWSLARPESLPRIT